MAHIKYISPAGWDWDRPIAVPLKWSGRGLIGNDLSDFVKVASDAFVQQIKAGNIKFAKDEEPVHLIALGASEAYGPNRNGDAFTEAVCRSCHPTFMKFAHWFRNHRNKPEKGHPYFGIIKASAYNPAMRRIELLVALNRTKSACERNGGFVADAELEKLASGQDIPVSMACRVAHDVCSFCGNKAANKDEYCTSSMCKAGGCKDNLTRLVKVAGDLHHLHVLNPNPVWFDISRVFRPADRIAYGAKADWLSKAAEDRGVFDLYEGIKMASDDTAPLEVVMYQDGLPGQWTMKIAAQIKLAYGMATVEDRERGGDPEIYRAFASDIQSPFPVDTLGSPGTEKCAAALGTLAERKVILPIRDFARLAGKQELAKEAAARLPGIYRRMVEDDSLERRIEQNKFPLSEKLAASRQRAVAGLVSEEYSLEKDAVWHRSTLSALRGCPIPAPKTSFEKTGSDHVEAEQLARDYAIYKVAALERIAVSDNNFPLTVRYAIRQNHVS